MPFINIKTNAQCTKGRELKLKTALGEAISTLPGKSEDWLMLAVEPQTIMYFKGTNDLCAIAQVSIYGEQSKDAKNALTAKLTKIINDELKVDVGRIYVSYTETPDWGFNGENF